MLRLVQPVTESELTRRKLLSAIAHLRDAINGLRYVMACIDSAIQTLKSVDRRSTVC